MQAVASGAIQVYINLEPHERFIMVHPALSSRYPIIISGAVVHRSYIYVVAHRVAGTGQQGAGADFTISHTNAHESGFPASFKAVLRASQLVLQTAMKTLVEEGRNIIHQEEWDNAQRKES